MILIKIYLLLILLIIVHELAHYICLKALKIKIYDLVIGNFIYLKFNKLRISPFIFSGYITYDNNQFNQLHLYQKTIIVLSGICTNIIGYFLINETMYLYKHLTLLYLIFILIPLPFLNTDTYVLFKIIKKTIKKNYI